jgi:hypothetical protein
MTEAQWAACRDPRRMLDYHRMKKDPRRLRLLAVACVRLALPPDPWAEAVLDAVERYADGTAGRAEFLAARKTVRRADKTAHPHARLLGSPGGLTDDAMEGLTATIENVRTRAGGATECGLIRCLFPFRPVPFDPAWRTSSVVAMARQMYESRDFSAMPILADAMQDADCDNADLLKHCRGDGPHARGCWVVDGLLG